MDSQTALLALVVCLRCVSLCLSAETGCFKVNSCKCIMKDGTGVINLQAVGDPEDFRGCLRPLPPSNTPPNTDIFLRFSPCQPLSELEDLAVTDCKNVAACLIIRFHKLNRYVSSYVNYGIHEGNVFHYNGSAKTLSVSYFVPSHDDSPLTIVHYHCSPNTSTSLVRSPQELAADEPLQIWVESPCACANACAMGDLGLGTIFLIVLCISAAAYFILGSCALKPFRNSSGVQIAPEESVWCMLCYLFTERQAYGGRKRHSSVRGEMP